MRKILALCLVFIFISVKDSNASTIDSLVWTAGSAVNVTFGPEDAVYCRLKDNKGTIVFDGFGPCRVVLDRVTREHRGSWELFVGAPGTVIVRNSWVDVDVVAAVDSAPVVTTSVENRLSNVILTCSMPEDNQVQSCTFRNPSNKDFIASHGLSEDGYDNHLISYKSYVKDNICKLTLLEPLLENQGIWRCTVNTIWGTSYGFIDVTRAVLDAYDNVSYKSRSDTFYTPYYKTVPELETKYNGISGTEGNAVTMSCSIGAPLLYCYFRAPNGTVFNVRPSTSTASYKYVGNGFDAGECGIRFNNIWTSAQGQWSCNVGLTNTSFSYFQERRDFFHVYVNERLMVYHRWEGSSMVVRLRISTGPELEYCRFVRSDGVGFLSERANFPYFFDVDPAYGTCTLYIERPLAEDLRPWTVVAKVSGEDEELSVTTTLEPQSYSMRGISRNASIILWCLFGSVFVFLIIVSFLPKKNREWTHQRAVRIRNSFRRQPQPQPQNVADIPNANPVHIDILTDLPRKV